MRGYLNSHPRLLSWAERVRPEIEKFVIAGPTLIGYVLGLLRYPPGSVAFETAFQSLVIFVAYLAALVIAQAFDSLFFSSMPIILAVVRSLLAFFYLLVTIRQYIEWRKGEPRIFPLVERVRERLNFLIGNAA
jgi:hypothetical protein